MIGCFQLFHDPMAPGEVSGNLARYRFGYEDGRFSIFADTEKLKGFPLVSERNPVREAERHIGLFRLRPGMLALVAGLAHLPMLELLVEQLKTPGGQGGLIIVFEADTALYLSLKKSRPDIFSEIAVIVPENQTVLTELVERLDVEHFVGYRTFENKPSVELNPRFYSAAIHEFKQKLASRFSDLFTRLEFEERWVFNSLSKIPHLNRMRPVSALFGIGKGSEVIIVSTGPSLRDSLPELRAQQDNFFIACADSAYRVLHRYGINPHLIFSLDSQPHTGKHFALLPNGKRGSYPILVCDAVSNPPVARNWQGEMALSFTAQYVNDVRAISPGCDFLEAENFFTGLRGVIPGDLQSGGSVATSIFDLMRLMDFDRIIFVGQDLAYTRREIHTPGTHHTDEWLSKTTNRLQPLENINERVIRRRHTKREIGIGGRPVVTDYILSLYRDWFQNATERLPQKIYNASRGGLTLPGALPLSELVSVLPSRNAKIFEQYLRSAYLSTRPRQQKSFTRDASFLRYVGRKFAIKATRNPDNKDALTAKQKVRQESFLRKLEVKLTPYA